ncbi:MAG: hypothetical protein PF436_03210 [Prolixibacteraceae bacterium]|jgi:hypothetical protein|nr:hypothetical protein [Prolixibacteraceae bacterium]
MTEPQYAVLECPECGEQYIISSPTDSPSETATLFSDGYFIEDGNIHWRTPLVIGCVTCELGFMPVKGKQIAFGTLDELLEKFPNIKKAMAPTAGTLVLDLRARLHMELDEEVAIRRELWYASQHTSKGCELLERNKKFEAFYQQNLLRLIECVQLPVLKAELNRQAGMFDQCLNCLENETDSMATLIAQQAKVENTGVFKVSNAI